MLVSSFDAECDAQSQCAIASIDLSVACRSRHPCFGPSASCVPACCSCGLTIQARGLAVATVTVATVPTVVIVIVVCVPGVIAAAAAQANLYWLPAAGRSPGCAAVQLRYQLLSAHAQIFNTNESAPVVVSTSSVCITSAISMWWIRKKMPAVTSNSRSVL